MVVIGGGTGGLVSAAGSAGLYAKVSTPANATPQYTLIDGMGWDEMGYDGLGLDVILIRVEPVRHTRPR